MGSGDCGPTVYIEEGYQVGDFEKSIGDFGAIKFDPLLLFRQISFNNQSIVINQIRTLF